MVLTVLYGGYTYLFTSPDNDLASPEKAVESLGKFATEVAASLRDNDLSDNYSKTLTQAAAEWKTDPFLQAGLMVKSEASASENTEENRVSAKEVSFTYSGYLNIGNRKLAIINGMEYEAGEDLEPGRYFVKSISPVRVVVGARGGDRDMILLLEEMD